MGGAQRMADKTGSRCFERFTIHQIIRLMREQNGLLERLERISLVSSFVTSLLLGDFAPIDYADGSGMNCLNIVTKTWVRRTLRCLDLTYAQDEDIMNFADKSGHLRRLLGDPVPSSTLLGRLSKYFVERFD